MNTGLEVMALMLSGFRDKTKPQAPGRTAAHPSAVTHSKPKLMLRLLANRLASAAGSEASVSAGPGQSSERHSCQVSLSPRHPDLRLQCWLLTVTLAHLSSAAAACVFGMW